MTMMKAKAMADSHEQPADWVQRQRALDVTGSFVVQAPAGSGKTELLIQRILALLAVVNTPEEILAITFTRKAAAEMHKRLLEALEKARSQPVPVQPHAAHTWLLARAALERDHDRDWNLLECPARLQVMTIDSFCAALVRRMPYLARFGEAPAIAEDPVELYRAAAEALLTRLERGGVGCDAIARLLQHLDNRLPLLRDLLVSMLGRRDQWLRHLDPVNLAAARPDLECALRQQVVAAMTTLRACLGAELLSELWMLGGWAAGNLDRAGGDNPLAALLDCSRLPETTATELPAWQALVHLTLTNEGKVREALSKTLGFPAGTDPVCQAMKQRAGAAFDRLRSHPVAVERLKALRHLPACTYTDDQWEVLSALIELLPMADRELRSIFRACGQVDFTEIARGALAALGDELAPADLLLHLDSRLQHILVDEFQDTSRGQYELVSRLTAGWVPGDGRTLFVVGDPMQSIYRFREAEVGLYLRIRRLGFDNVRLEPLVLQVNFRSQAGLVDWFNSQFAQLFPAAEDELRGAVPYSAATAVNPAASGPAVTLACFDGRNDVAEARHIIELIRHSQSSSPQGSVAILVRSRSHLAALVPALKQAGLAFQAQEIDPLTSRPAILDLLALTRALLHPADRVAWLSVLRAPWCGLGLDDLLLLCGHQAAATVWECLIGPAGQPQLFSLLSADGQARLSRLVPVLEKILAGKGRVPLRRMIEGAWLALGGPAGLEREDLDDAEQFFALLEELDEGCDLLRLETFEERLGKLFAAPNPNAGPALQLMTIHKAKGLEFDTVILPGLGRPVRLPEHSLLLWQEQLDYGRKREGLLLAPIPASAADDQDPTYQSIARMHAEKDRLETLRLLYVAATRARQRLHLFGHAKRNQEGTLSPAAGSLFRAAWPALAEFAEAGAITQGEESATKSACGVLLRRLPLDWHMPQFAAPLAIAIPAPRRASDAGHHVGRGAIPGLRAETGRIVGTVVHQWLERFARDGVENWTEDRLTALRPELQDAMLNHGIARGRAKQPVERVLAALGNALRSQRGRWILGDHQESDCELALTGVLDGVTVHAVIDRTFVDSDGVRWVVDYKTSESADAQGIDLFIEEEVGRYRSQLEDYKRLLGMKDPERQIRGALYFPIQDLWCVVD